MRGLRLLLVALALGLPAVPAGAKDEPESFCERVAQTAYELNSSRDTQTVVARNSAPFVQKYLVSSAFEADPGAESYRKVGEDQECLNEETGEYRRCGIPDGTIHFDMARIFETNPDLHEHYVRWSRTAGLIPTDRGLAAVRAAADYSPYRNGWTTGVFMTSIIDKESMRCAFDNKIHETYRSEDNSPCQSIAGDDSSLLVADEPLPDGSHDALFDPSDSFRPRDHYLNGYLDVDVDADGKAERLIAIEFGPGNGSCFNSYFDVLAPGSFIEFADEDIRQLVRAAQADQFDGPLSRARYSCYKHTYLRERDGRLFFERTGVGKARADGQPLIVTGQGPGQGPLQRTMRVIEDGAVNEVCTTKFSIEPIVVYDRDRAEQDGVTPE